MLNKIAIIGAQGGMGRRYRAILRFLNIDAALFDVADWGLVSHTVGIDGIIIASPTACHYENLKEVKRLGVPVLCEKPITKDPHELKEILSWGMNLRMVNQYEYLVTRTEGSTYYDYYNTGRDGLGWDCINIIGLAQNKPVIRSHSPIWRCQINSQRLSIADMDRAYISMVGDWSKDPRPNTEYIIKAHERVKQGRYEEGNYWYTGEEQ